MRRKCDGTAVAIIARGRMKGRAHVALVVEFLPVADGDNLVPSSMTLDESSEPLWKKMDEEQR